MWGFLWTTRRYDTATGVKISNAAVSSCKGNTSATAGLVSHWPSAFAFGTQSAGVPGGTPVDILPETSYSSPRSIGTNVRAVLPAFHDRFLTNLYKFSNNLPFVLLLVHSWLCIVVCCIFIDVPPSLLRAPKISFPNMFLIRNEISLIIQCTCITHSFHWLPLSLSLSLSCHSYKSIEYFYNIFAVFVSFASYRTSKKSCSLLWSLFLCLCLL
jgi:hypothetical protein